MTSETYSQSLLKVIEENTPKLFSMKDELFNSKPPGMNWSRKEILGHLIDSASNNHHRFIKIQSENSPFQIIGYKQDDWVENNAYKTQSKDLIISLWNAYNTQLSHVIANIPKTKLNAECLLKDESKVTLEFIIKDYINHMVHHLNQIYSK